MQGGSAVATQLLSRLQATNPNAGLEETRHFLSLVGRIRANEVELRDLQGHVLYHSPPPLYKAGRDAPAWYSAIVSPQVKTKTIDLGQGQMLLRSDPSRAVLDGWDAFVPMLSTVVLGLVIGNLLVFFLVGRVLEPIARVIHGLRAISQGNYDVRLPAMRGQEAQLMGQAFNAMAQSVQDGITAREKVRAATDALAQNRELTKVIQTRIEAVQGQIARELHDELGQQVTAIKSVGLAIAHRARGLDAQIESSAQMVVACADAMYEGVHQLVTQLRPLALDRFGLRDALQDLVSQARSRQPEVRIQLNIGRV
jgi:two-component system sensor histidine kinase UhpB